MLNIKKKTVNVTEIPVVLQTKNKTKKKKKRKPFTCVNKNLKRSFPHVAKSETDIVSVTSFFIIKTFFTYHISPVKPCFHFFLKTVLRPYISFYFFPKSRARPRHGKVSFGKVILRRV